jgi:hypothetical protein
VTEAELQARVIEMARALGLAVHWQRDSRRAEPGFPDLVIAGPRGVLFAELKSEAGRLSPQQRFWQHILVASGARWRLWRPADLDCGLIDEDLAALAA